MFHDINGMPMIRKGDTVYLIGKMPDLSGVEAMKEQMEFLLLAADEYECPFDFMTEFDQWFEWRERLYFRKQSTGKIITSMLSDVERIKAHKIERPVSFRVESRFDCSPMLSNHAFLTNFA